MAPMKVFGWAVSPWMARVLVCLEEAGAEYQIVPMSRSGGDHRGPELLARNPFGQIPVLEDGDLTLYQSRAIARYILRNYKPAHQLEPLLLTIVVNCIINPHVGGARDQAAVDESLAKLRAALAVYEARLSVSRYLAGDDVTAADLCHFGFMRYFMATEYAGVVDTFPRVKVWWDALLARPSVQKVMAGMPPDFGFGSGNIP